MSKGYIHLIIASIIIGSIGIFSRWINLPAPVQNFYRYLFAALALASYLIINKDPLLRFRGNIKGLIGSSISYAVASVLLFIGFNNTSIANTVVLFYTAPLFVALLAPYFLREPLKKRTIVSLAIAFIGVLFLSLPTLGLNNGKEIIGIVAGLGSGIAFALMIVSTKAVSATLPFIRINFYQNLLAAVVLLPSAFSYHYTMSAKALGLLIVIGVVHTAIARTLWVSGVSKVPAQDSGDVGYIEPLSAAVFGLIFFGEVPSALGIVGAVLILVSSYVVTKNPNKQLRAA